MYTKRTRYSNSIDESLTSLYRNCHGITCGGAPRRKMKEFVFACKTLKHRAEYIDSFATTMRQESTVTNPDANHLPMYESPKGANLAVYVDSLHDSCRSGSIYYKSKVKLIL